MAPRIQHATFEEINDHPPPKISQNINIIIINQIKMSLQVSSMVLDFVFFLK